MAKLMKENDNCQDEEKRNDISDEVAAECPQIPNNVHHHALVPRLTMSERLLG
jgi:hypothetical protein